MRTWFREHGLVLVNAALFLGFFVGMVLTGAASYSSSQQEHHGAPVSVLQYLGTGDFVEATFENWESEFLQMGSYVVLTAFLFQRGSAESKSLDERAGQDPVPDAPEDPDPDDRPWPVRRGGVWLKLYENSLLIVFAALFLMSVLLHAAGGAAAYNQDQMEHHGPAVSYLGFFGTSDFWFQSFQNWQSEFMVVTLIVLTSKYLRQKGSSQSKPVAMATRDTGD